MLFDPNGHDIERTGVPLDLCGRSCNVFVTLGGFLADAPALKDVLGSKGHSGIKPCILCMNAVQQKNRSGGGGTHLCSDYAVSIAELEPFKLNSDQACIRRAETHTKTHTETISKGRWWLELDLGFIHFHRLPMISVDFL